MTRAPLTGCCALLTLSAAVAPLRGQASSPRPNSVVVGPSRADSLGQRRLERLETLADVWVKLELYHPLLAAQSKLDWDTALTRAIPRVEAARTSEEFVAVLNEELFAPLGDPLSFARSQAEADARDRSAVSPPLESRLVGARIGYLDARNTTPYFAPGFQKEVRAAITRLGALDLLVVDLRWEQKHARGGAPWLSLWVSAPLQTGAVASRMHRGFSAARWTMLPGAVLAPAASTDSLPPITVATLFLTNLTSYPSLERHLDALQGTERVAVALEQSGPLTEEWAILTYPERIRVRLHAAMPISRGGTLGTLPDTILTRRVALADIPALWQRLRRRRAAAPRPAFSHAARPRPRYAERSTPLSREERILGLVRLWKEIGAFSAYLPYASVDWQTVLRTWIPRVEAASSTREYFLTLRRLVAQLNDSHASVHHPTVTAPDWTIPAYLRRVAGGRVVVARLDAAYRERSIAVGDEVLAVDGVPVRAVEDSLRLFRSASHPGAHYRNVWEYAEGVRGAQGTPVRLTVTGPTGTREVVLRRSTNWRSLVFTLSSRDTLVRRLPGNIGYIDLYNASGERMLDSALAALETTDALILDTRRGGPAWRDPVDLRSVLVSRFLDEPVVEPKGGIVATYMLGGPPIHALEQQAMTYVPFRNDADIRYAKPLAILISARNQSVGETMVFPLKLANRAIFVGSRTAGTNGGAPDFSLPGGGYAVFTHERITYPGGGRFHGVGIEPDVESEATVEGIRSGRDEVLERAIDVLLQRLHQRNQPANRTPSHPDLTGPARQGARVDGGALR